MGAIFSPPIKESPQLDKNCFSDSTSVTSLREDFRPTERADLGPQKKTNTTEPLKMEPKASMVSQNSRMWFV